MVRGEAGTDPATESPASRADISGEGLCARFPNDSCCFIPQRHPTPRRMIRRGPPPGPSAGPNAPNNPNKFNEVSALCPRECPNPRHCPFQASVLILCRCAWHLR